MKLGDYFALFTPAGHMVCADLFRNKDLARLTLERLFPPTTSVEVRRISVSYERVL